MLVGAFMLLYARRAVAPEPEPQSEPVSGGAVDTLSEEHVIESGQEFAGAEVMSEPVPPSSQSHCPYCARTLEENYAFCPGCGHETSGLRRCAHCGHQQLVAPELNVVYCVQCGEKIAP